MSHHTGSWNGMVNNIDGKVGVDIYGLKYCYILSLKFFMCFLMKFKYSYKIIILIHMVKWILIYS